MVKNVRVPNVEYLENNKPETFDECFNASNIRKSQEACRNCRTLIRVGLQYMLYMKIFLYFIW